MNPSRRHIHRVVLGLAILAAALALAVPRWRGKVVRFVYAERRELVQTVVASGRVMPPAEIELGALVSSRVVEVGVDKGDRVHKGQVLVRLDDRDVRASLAQARASLARARAQKNHVRTVSGPMLAESLVQAKARRADAERRHKDNQALYARGAITKNDLDNSATELALAESQYQSARSQADSAAPRGTETAAASAAIGVASAELESAAVRLERTSLVAPVDGVVLARSVEPGEVVQVGESLLTIARTGLTQLVIEPDERNLALLALGQPAHASAEAFPSQTFAARVAFLAPSIDPKRGTVEVRLEVPEPPAYLRPAMTVSVEIEVARERDALSVESSVVRDLATGRPWVLVAREGRAHRVDVTLGLSGDRRVQILSGVETTTPIIPVSELGVGPGTRVRGG